MCLFTINIFSQSCEIQENEENFSNITTNTEFPTVNNILIKDIDVPYILIVGTSQIFSNKLSIQVDFGQSTKFFGTNNIQIRDEKGKLMKFNSMIDALNFFNTYGYKFVNAYVITIGNQNVYHFLLEKVNKNT